MGIATLDGERLYAALNAHRSSLDMTWSQVADKSEVSASTLTRLSQGKRPDVDSLAALCTWAGLDTDEFYEITGQVGHRKPLTEVIGYLRADENLSDEAADALSHLLQTAYQTLSTKG